MSLHFGGRSEVRGGFSSPRKSSLTLVPSVGHADVKIIEGGI